MIGFLGSVLAFVFVFGIVVFLHEFGHFVTAKMFGMRVLAFSFGFGSTLWKFQKGETEYKICILPLGGYVKLDGEGGSTKNSNDFSLKPRWQRLVVLFAGPFMNLFLAIAIVAICFMLGHRSVAVVTASPIIGAVEDGSLAENAGILAGDVVVAIGGKPISRWSEVHQAVTLSSDRPLVFSIARGEERFVITIIPKNIDESRDIGHAGIWPVSPVRIASVLKESPADRAGFLPGDEIVALDTILILHPATLMRYFHSRAGKVVSAKVLRGKETIVINVSPEAKDGKGMIGVKLAEAKTSLSFMHAIPASVRFNKDMVLISGKVIGDMFRGRREPGKTIAGPIGIAKISGEVARGGVVDLLFWVGILSMNLAIFNILPIPLMDGGHISILLIEMVVRRDFSPRVKGAINLVGFFFIIFLFVFSTFTDIERIFGK